MESESQTKNGAPVVKKAKLAESGDDSTQYDTASRFAGFELGRVLSDNSERKMMVVTGRFSGREDEAVVVVEKSPLTPDTVKQMLTNKTRTELTLQNDIYGTFQCFPPPSSNSLKTTVICPATEKHIQKYSTQEAYLVEESPADYTNITLPFIEKENFSIQWVFNILEKKSETERIVFEDADPETGFLMLPDMKWDGKQVEDLYLVAIVNRHGIRSLRDLNSTHLPLLNNIRDKGLKAIEDKYGIKRCKLRVYFHYQPSYYHLHVHFTHLSYAAPGSGTEKAHLLSNVIGNIEMMSDYYQKATLPFVTTQHHGLCKRYKELGKI